MVKLGVYESNAKEQLEGYEESQSTELFDMSNTHLQNSVRVASDARRRLRAKYVK